MFLHEELIVGILAIKKKNVDINPFITKTAPSEPSLMPIKNPKQIIFNKKPNNNTGFLLPLV